MKRTAIEMTPEALSATIRTRFFDAVLRSRAFVTVMNLAARRNAQPAIGRAACSSTSMRESNKAATPRRSGGRRNSKCLSRSIGRTTWNANCALGCGRKQSTSPWRQALAMLLAERGKLDEAIQIFEALEKDQLLAAVDYRTLSDWYLVTDRRADYEKSRIESYKQMPEQVMNSMFWGLRNRWMRTDLPLPSKLDDNTLLAMRALFEKSANPENYFWQLRELVCGLPRFPLARHAARRRAGPLAAADLQLPPKHAGQRAERSAQRSNGR